MFCSDAVKRNRTAAIGPEVTHTWGSPPGAVASLTMHTSQSLHDAGSPAHPPGQPIGACSMSGNSHVAGTCRVVRDPDAIIEERLCAYSCPPTAVGTMNVA